MGGFFVNTWPGRADGRIRDSSSSFSTRLFRQQLAHERALVAQYTTRLVTDPVGGDELRIAAEQRPVVFIAGQAVEAEQRQGQVTRALGRQEIPVVPPAVLVDQAHPFLREALESLGLGGVDRVMHDAGDHRGARRWNRSSS